MFSPQPKVLNPALQTAARANMTFSSPRPRPTIFYNDALSKSELPKLDGKRVRSKESIREIRKIRKVEEEKSRMLNTFIPRPSYSKWVMKKEDRFQKKSDYTNEESSSEESDYYGTESEQSRDRRPKPGLKIGRLSTVKEKIDISQALIHKYTRMMSGGDGSRFYPFYILGPMKRDIIKEEDSEFHSDLDSVFNADFDKDAPPPLKMTNSIEINKSDLRTFRENDLNPFQDQPRMLHTP